MANLNFQQPPRSIPNASLAGRSTGGFGGNSLSGHVTPTSGMFPPGGTAFGQTQQSQLSPNRNAQLSVGGNGPPQLTNNSRANLFGQRAFGDRRAMQGLGSGPMSNMGSFMQSRGGFNTAGGIGGGSSGGLSTSSTLSNFHSVFSGNSGDTATPPLLDLSEFPSLTNARGQNDQSLPQTNTLQPPGSKPYVGMVKQPTTEQSEFTMSNEDFPALPGTQISDDTSSITSSSASTTGITGNIGENSIDKQNSTGTSTTTSTATSLSSSTTTSSSVLTAAHLVTMDMSQNHQNHQSNSTMTNNNNITNSSSNKSNNNNNNDDDEDTVMKPCVEIFPNGRVTNIPGNMINNQFGMVGLLTFIRAAETDPNLVTLAMGQDLTGLGLNLNSSENLHPTFAGPFADQPCRPQDIEYNVPPEYLVNVSIRDKLASITLKKYKDDLLFFLFYTNVGDVMQLAAAAELHSREWRYHMEEKVWITRIPGITHYEKNGTKERGTFYYFDAQNWRRVPKDFEINTEYLEKCPNLNAIVSLTGQPV